MINDDDWSIFVNQLMNMNQSELDMTIWKKFIELFYEVLSR